MDSKLLSKIQAILGLPAGGSDGQYLGRSSGQPAWVNAPSGSGGDWQTISATLTYASADSPTFVMTTGGVDLTGIIPLGARLKYTQTTVKFGIVVAITSTTITVYCGTDYSVVNAAISNPCWSGLKSPFGFPLNPDKWSLSVTSTAQLTNSTPTANTWYNLGGASAVSLSVPIGAWLLSWTTAITCEVSGGGTAFVMGSLGLANNSALDEFKGYSFQLNNGAASATDFRAACSIYKESNVIVAAKTVYYLNALTGSGLTNPSISFRGDTVKIIVKAICNYL